MKKARHLLYVLIFLFSGTALSGIALHSPPPENLDDLIENSVIIVVGTFGEIAESGNFYGYGDDAALLAEKDKETFFSIGLPKIDIPIYIKELIKGDDLFYAGDQSMIIFRYFENLESATSEEAIKDREGEKLFFLGRNPDNETYGIGTIASLIHLDDPESGGLTYTEPYGVTLRGERIKVPYISGSASAQELLTEIRNRVIN